MLRLHRIIWRYGGVQNGDDKMANKRGVKHEGFLAKKSQLWRTQSEQLSTFPASGWKHNHFFTKFM